MQNISLVFEPDIRNKVDALIAKSLPAIAQERSETDSWNYWLRDSVEYKSKPYPDDLDDTFNVHLLFLITNKSFTAKTTQNIIEQLLNTERTIVKNSCAYNTWLYRRCSTSEQDIDVENKILDDFKGVKNFEDIDPVVQVAVYKILSKLNALPEKFKHFLTSHISNSGFLKSKYYTSELYVLSELSSIYTREINTFIASQVKTLQTKKESSVLSFFDTILLAQTKLNIDKLSIETNTAASFRNIFHCVLKVCRTASIFPSKITPEPIFVETISNDIPTYCYSRSVVLALYIKLLATLKLTLVSISDNRSQARYGLEQKERFTKLNQKLKTNFYSYVNNIARNTNNSNAEGFPLDEIIQTIFKDKNPLQTVYNELYDFAHNLKSPTTPFTSALKHTVNTLDSIYEATLLGWISYTAFDAIIDNEIPDTCLPFANICNTHMLDILFHKVNVSKNIKEIILQLVDEVNIAQHNEIKINTESTKRNTPTLPVGQNLQSSKSIGHCIGPICIFAIKSPHTRVNDLKHLISFYRYYLSVKQLSDDVHDWQEDMSRGRKTFVTKFIHKECKQDKDPIDTFTKSTIYKVYEEMKRQTDIATYHLRKIERCFNRTYIDMRLEDLSKYTSGVKRAIHEIEVYNLFIKSSETP